MGGRSLAAAAASRSLMSRGGAWRWGLYRHAAPAGGPESEGGQEVARLG
jgi:hypothetical protein